MSSCCCRRFPASFLSSSISSAFAPFSCFLKARLMQQTVFPQSPISLPAHETCFFMDIRRIALDSTTQKSDIASNAFARQGRASDAALLHQVFPDLAKEPGSCVQELSYATWADGAINCNNRLRDFLFMANARRVSSPSSVHFSIIES
jgi:hypothetical protein